VTTLVVLLPPRDGTQNPTDWQLPACPFVYLDGAGRRLSSGVAELARMPRADEQVLILAPSDVLLLRATIPPVAAQRLRQALPNLVEDQLLQDAARCHFAVGTQASAEGQRTIAVVDRAWMRFLGEQFGAGEGRRLRAVALGTCLTDAPAESCYATVVDGPWPDTGRVEVTISAGGLPFGVALPREHLDAALVDLARGLTLRRARLDGAATGSSGNTVTRTRDLTQDEPTLLTLESIAARAVSAQPDLCQFEFATQRWHGVRTTALRWRVPLSLAVACVVVCLIGINAQWFALARERAAMSARAEQLLRDAFPKTTVIQDAPLQMTRDLEVLRATAGELAASDFLALTARLGDATGALPAGSVSALDYSDRTLTATFKSGAVPDASVINTLRGAGLSVRADGDKWLIKSEGK
jgi:general secretion pathway protein L